MSQPTSSEAYDEQGLRLARLTEHDAHWRDLLMTHELPREQRQFATTARTSLPLSDADPNRASIAIIVGDAPVGMFVLDHGGYFRDFEPDSRAILLRAFYIASEHQGRGYARIAVSLVADFVRAHTSGT